MSRDKGCMRFVKYLSSDCPCDLYDVQNTYKVESLHVYLFVLCLIVRLLKTTKRMLLKVTLLP